jgi:hypothetical protein
MDKDQPQGIAPPFLGSGCRGLVTIGVSCGVTHRALETAALRGSGSDVSPLLLVQSDTLKRFDRALSGCRIRKKQQRDDLFCNPVER